MIPTMSRPVIAAAILSPLVVLAAFAGGWPGLILCSVFGALIVATLLDDRR